MFLSQRVREPLFGEHMLYVITRLGNIEGQRRENKFPSAPSCN
jgi:hypothetical protein